MYKSEDAQLQLAAQAPENPDAGNGIALPVKGGGVDAAYAEANKVKIDVADGKITRHGPKDEIFPEIIANTTAGCSYLSGEVSK